MDTDLNEEEDIRMENSREKHWRDVAEDGENKSKIHALKWYVYKREREEFTKREFSVSVTHMKGGNIVWTYVKDDIIEEKEDHKATVYLETTHGLNFETPKFPRHVIYSRYRLDKENPYMQKNPVCAILDELCYFC